MFCWSTSASVSQAIFASSPRRRVGWTASAGQRFVRALLLVMVASRLAAAETKAAATPPRPESPVPAKLAMYYIREYRVRGANLLGPREIQEAIYGYLGPRRTERDVDHARAALERAYQERGFQTVSVEVPPQQVKGGVVYLQVVEREVGRLRVKGAKYSAPSRIKQMAPSLAEGTVINFNNVPSDVRALNQSSDRQVLPSLKPGTLPNTVDVDLEVKETRPVHGSLELNNRRGPDTVPLRVNGAVSATNLWQRSHALGFNFQIAPQDMNEVKVFSGYYLARFESLPGFGLMLQGASQNTNISTVGSTAVFGRGETVGLRALFNLPSSEKVFQSVSVGLDYKRNRQRIRLGSTGATSGAENDDILAPVTYYPLSANYSATWIQPRATTELNSGVTLHFRGLGSDPKQFGARRYKSDGAFIYWRADLAQTRELPAGLQLFGKVQGQIASQPLLDPEQFTGGGLGTVRGYYEGEAAADNGVAGTLELRSPSLLSKVGYKEKGEWRVYLFADGAALKLNDPLPEQKDEFRLASYGAGSRVQFSDYFSGSVDAGVPYYKQAKTAKGDTRVTFRAALQF